MAGIMGYGPGLFYEPVCEALNVGRGDIAFAQTISSLTSAAFIVFFSKVLNRTKHLNWLITAGALGVYLSFAMQSSFTALWQWYLSAFASGFFGAIAFSMLIPMLVNRWFKDKIGFALGIAMTAGGLGGIIFTNFGTHVIVEFGWRTAYIAMAILAAVLAVPAALFLKSSPEDIGLSPYGETTQKAEQQAAQDLGIDYRSALKSIPFFLLVIGIAILNFPNSMSGYYISFADSIGYKPQTGALLATVLMIATSASKPVLGIINDRIGTFRSSMIMLPLLAMAYLLITFFNQSKGILFGAVAFTGFVTAVNAIMPSLYTLKLFGRRDFVSIFAAISMFTRLISAFSQSLIGYLYDWTGTYSTVFISCAASCTLGMILLWLAFRISDKSRREIADFGIRA